MKRTAKIFFLVLLILASPAALLAKTIVLGVGENYTEGDLNVMCVDQKRDAVVELTECQFWDDFNNRCLYERKIFTYNDIQCVEECQHWDSFNKRCDYAVSCSFQPSSGLFLRRTCDEFDSFNHACVRQKEELLGDAGRKKHGR